MNVVQVRCGYISTANPLSRDHSTLVIQGMDFRASPDGLQTPPGPNLSMTGNLTQSRAYFNSCLSDT